MCQLPLQRFLCLYQHGRGFLTFHPIRGQSGSSNLSASISPFFTSPNVTWSTKERVSKFPGSNAQQLQNKHPSAVGLYGVSVNRVLSGVVQRRNTVHKVAQYFCRLRRGTLQLWAGSLHNASSMPATPVQRTSPHWIMLLFSISSTAPLSPLCMLLLLGEDENLYAVWSILVFLQDAKGGCSLVLFLQ